jgi:hypothetical protein
MWRIRHRIDQVLFDRDEIEARLALNLIASADMPQIAWDALEAGLDGPATRRLAALEHPTYFEVAEVLPRVKQELALTEITAGQAALRMAKQIAREILNKGDNPLRHVQTFESLWVRSGYAKDIQALGTMHDDVWVAQSMGCSDEQIRDWGTSILKEFAE